MSIWKSYVQAYELLLAFQKIDCDVLIQNFGYAVKQNCGESEDVFRIAMTASLEHQFNDHHFCGNWCKYVDIPEEQWNGMDAADNYKLKTNNLMSICTMKLKKSMIFLLLMKICIF